MATTLVQFRVDEELKDQVSKISEKEGLDLGSALRVFMHQVVNEGRLPFMRRMGALDDEIELTEEERALDEKLVNSAGFLEAMAEVEAYERGEGELLECTDFRKYVKEIVDEIRSEGNREVRQTASEDVKKGKRPTKVGTGRLAFAGR